METNQKNKIMKNLVAAALVIIVAVILFLGMRVADLENELKGLATQIEGLKGNIVHVPVEEQDNSVEEASPAPTDAVEQVISSAIETEKPPEVTGVEPDAKHKVYLTFDDGPSKRTEEILEILDEYGVKATFFVVGRAEKETQERLQMIYERGHTIGMHSYSHDYSEIYDSVEAFREDFLKSKQYIYDAIGVESVYYRFPGGSSNKLSDISMKEFVAFLDEQGVEYYDWNISSGDGGAHLVPVEVLLENCTKAISRHDTSIILMHDSRGKSTTVEALPQIIETIQAMEDTVILPITENTKAVHHVIKEKKPKEEAQSEEDADSETKTAQEQEKEDNIEENPKKQKEEQEISENQENEQGE